MVLGQHLKKKTKQKLKFNFWRRSKSVVLSGSEVKLQFVSGRTSAVSPICFANRAACAPSTIATRETPGLQTFLTVE